MAQNNKMRLMLLVVKIIFRYYYLYFWGHSPSSNCMPAWKIRNLSPLTEHEVL